MCQRAPSRRLARCRRPVRWEGRSYHPTRRCGQTLRVIDGTPLIDSSLSGPRERSGHNRLGSRDRHSRAAGVSPCSRRRCNPETRTRSPKAGLRFQGSRRQRRSCSPALMPPRCSAPVWAEATGATTDRIAATRPDITRTEMMRALRSLAPQIIGPQSLGESAFPIKRAARTTRRRNPNLRPPRHR